MSIQYENLLQLVTWTYLCL